MDVIQAAKKIINQKSLEGNDDAFYVMNLEDVKIKYEHWVEKIPRVMPYYAVKCNDDEEVLKLLRDLGTGFDCASKKEILQMLSLNVDSNKIIYAHTVKQISHLKLSAEKGIKKVTFDSEAELYKIKEFHPNSKVVLRIRFDASNSIINLGTKFGCNPITEAPKLIELCKELKINLFGIAFHVGSGTTDFGVYERALDAVRKLFDYAETMDIKMKFVDIGGGFIGKDLSIFDDYAKSINAGIERNFPSSDIEIISEPGRYFVDSAFSVVSQVILKKHHEDGQIYYYLNESIYMSFLIAHLYKEQLEFSIIRASEPEKEPKDKLSTVWGCTCNSRDKIIADRLIPELQMGDWIVFHNMGAYTTTVSTAFNGFQNLNIFGSADL
ncbi:unnamed protein product [Chironomus riparius]|uniref:ornithine decarboxylase n=1 Tax=Chironomus riparius TaxID=315576 RepID=A0A9N9RSR9_9DIPT|nr:unnamed protein product [Chironomus riparius]